MLKRPVILTIAVALVALTTLLVVLVRQGDGAHAPAISFPLLDGRQLTLSSLAGRPVLVTFWATSCSECRKEIPALIALYEQLAPQGLEMIAVAMPYDPPNRVLELSERMRIPYPVALDIEARAISAFGDVPATPTTFLISPQGRIIMQHSGLLDMEKLQDQITAMLPSAQRSDCYTDPIPHMPCSG